jgi:hypothetical protein
VVLWLAASDRLLPHKMRCTRNMCDNSFCSVCELAEESTIYVLRECPDAMAIWNRLVPQTLSHQFFEDEVTGG